MPPLFFFNDTATTEIYTLSLHDALPILQATAELIPPSAVKPEWWSTLAAWRSEEHTSELQSQSNLVCRLLLEKKKRKTQISALKNLQQHDQQRNSPHEC